MKRFFALFIALLMVVGFAPSNVQAQSNGGVILYTNDVHCAIDNYSKLAGYRGELIANGYDVVTVDAGDHIQGEVIGTLTYGSAAIDIMNSVGYDYSVPGNHEFDYGIDTFFDIAENQAAFTYLSCNFIELSTGDCVLKPYDIVDICGYSVALLGISTPETYTKSTPAYFQDDEGNFLYSFSEDKFYDTIQDSVNAAIQEGADLVIAIGHLGIDGVTEGWKSTDVIANTTGIDAFIDAHSHENINQEYSNKDGRQVLLTSTGTKFENFGAMYIDADGNIEASVMSFSSLTVEADTDVQSKIDGYNSELEYLFAELGTSEVDLVLNNPETDEYIVRKAEVNMGNFVADAYKAVSGAEISFANGGGVRAAIDKGIVTRKDLMDVNPWNNEMVVIKLTGQQIADALEFGARLYPENNGGFLQTSGLKYEMHTYIDSAVIIDGMGVFAEIPEGAERRVKNITVNDEPIKYDGLYTVVGSKYMLMQKGDGYNMFTGAEAVETEGLPVDSEMLVKYLTEDLNGIISEELYGNALGDGRITLYTEAPEVEIPATEVPETEPPATEVPETEAPATVVPETEAPATELPATELPVTEIPATETPEAAPNPDTDDNAGVIVVAASLALVLFIALRKRSYNC